MGRGRKEVVENAARERAAPKDGRGWEEGGPDPQAPGGRTEGCGDEGEGGMNKELKRLLLRSTFRQYLEHAKVTAELQKFEQTFWNGEFEDIPFQKDFAKRAFNYPGFFYLIESPTGSGKTIIEAMIAAMFLMTGKVMVVSSSGTALGSSTDESIIKKFHSFFKHIGLSKRIGHCFNDEAPSKLDDVHFFTPQGLAKLRRGSPVLFSQLAGSCSCLLIDEVHHFPQEDDADGGLIIFNQVFEVATEFFSSKGKKAVGLTATCYRLDGKKIMGKDKPDDIVTVQQLVDMGRCPEIRGIECYIDVKTDCIHKCGDFYSIKFSKKNKEIYWDQIADRMIDVQEMFPRPTCAFVRLVEEAYLLAEKFNAKRDAKTPPIAVMHGGTSKAERYAIIKGIREGRLLGYITCQVGEESLDIPPLANVHLIRRTVSTGRNMQGMGRGLRQWAGDDKFPKKDFALIIDYHLMSPGLIRACHGIREMAEACGTNPVGMVNGGCIVARSGRSRDLPPEILSMTTTLDTARDMVTCSRWMDNIEKIEKLGGVKGIKKGTRLWNWLLDQRRQAWSQMED